MFNVLKATLIFVTVCLCTVSHSRSGISGYPKHKLEPNSCADLLLNLIKTSSYRETFMDKKKAMEFYFERSVDNKSISMVFSDKSVSIRGIPEAFGDLDLVNGTLNIMALEIPVPIQINKQYLPAIAEKCTQDTNISQWGTFPDPEIDGVRVQRYEPWSHPVLHVFDKYGIILFKVSYEQDVTFATFNITFAYTDPPDDFNSEEARKIYSDIMKANSNFPYALVDDEEDKYVRVEWKDKSKKILKITIWKVSEMDKISF